MNDNTAVQMRYSADQEMQYEESTIDDSSIQPNLYSTPSGDWNLQQTNYSSPASCSKSHGKGSKKVKSEDDEDIDIDAYMQQDVQRIPVKTLRKVIPKLRIAVYCSDLMASGKRKLKHLWDERPSDWPQNIPFKDPNNACKDVKKPGKDELSPMFNFLKQKYLQSQSLQTSASFGSENDYKFSQQVVAESSTDKEAAFYSSVSSNPILPQIPFEQQTSDHNNSFLITPKPEPSPYVDISELMNTYGNGGTSPMVSLAQQGNLISVNASKPQPVAELFNRMEKKNAEVIALCPVENQGMILEILRKVQQAVIRKLYDEITPSDTRVCLMFLDAGHQMEALLDVMLVLKHVDVQLLDSGCQEIIKKFDTRNVGFVLCPQVVPQLSEKGHLSQSSSLSNGFQMNSRDTMSHNNLFCSKASDDIFRDLGLDLWENRKGKPGDTLENASEAPQEVQLFRPRHGTGGHGLEDSGLGIQKRPVPATVRGPDTGICSNAPVKGMIVMTEKEKEEEKMEEVIQHNVRPIEQQLEDIMRHLASPLTNHFYPMDNGNTMKDYPSDLLASDLDIISDIIMGDQSEDLASAEMNSSLPSFCQETGGGFSDEHSQLLPSSAAKVLPSMVESAIYADSDSEDSEGSSSFMDLRYDGGGMGNRGFALSQPFANYTRSGHFEWSHLNQNFN